MWSKHARKGFDTEAPSPVARRATTSAVGDTSGDNVGMGESPPLIAMDHQNPYTAAASAVGLRSLQRKQVDPTIAIGGARCFTDQTGNRASCQASSVLRFLSIPPCPWFFSYII